MFAIVRLGWCQIGVNYAHTFKAEVETRPSW